MITCADKLALISFTAAMAMRAYTSQQVARLDNVTNQWDSIDDMIAQGDFKVV